MADYIDRQTAIDAITGYNKGEIAAYETDLGILTVPTTSSATTLRYGAYAYPSVEATAYGYDEKINELKDMISQLKAKPYFMKIQCHNCGAPLVIDSSDHLIKCKYCHTAYFSGTQLVNSGM